MNSNFYSFFLTLVLTIMLGNIQCSALEDYLDTSLPREIPMVPYEGARYEAEVPDTLDLVDIANNSINMLTRCVAPEYDYEQHTGLHITWNPPLMSVYGGLVNLNPKWAEALPGLRVMTGSTYNIDVDGKIIGALIHNTGKDGLTYYPIENPGAFFEEETKKVGKPYSDVFGEGRQLLAYAAWYQHDKNPMWKEIAEHKIRRLLELSLSKEDTIYFRRSRGYVPGDLAEGVLVPIADTGVYDIEKGMTGAPATYISGFMPQASANWYRLTGFEPALELGGGLANYLFKYGEMMDYDTGKFTTDHYTHISHSLLANLAYALTVEDKEMVKWVKRGYAFGVRERDPDGTGILISDHTCSCFVADMINIGIMLSWSGEANYWEYVDRWVRNTFVNLQIDQDDVKKIKALPKKESKEGFYSTEQPWVYQYEDGADRVLGGWFHSLYEQDHSIGCCNGNLSRAIYYIWASIVDMEDDTLRVNLPLNRASPWADIHSYLPYEGKLVVQMKPAKKETKTFSDLMLDDNSAARDVLIRIPEWANWNRVSCTIDGKAQDYEWDKGYIRVDGVKDDAEVVVEFPIRQRTIATSINKEFIYESRHAKLPNAGGDFEATLRGNTIVTLNPDAGLPLSHHSKYDNDKVTMKKVTRFVSTEKFIW
jgi:hypothetical protein